MGKHFNDLTGQKFGRLTVIERDMDRIEKVYWLCECECGNIISILGAELTRKSRQGTISCGCWRRENMSNIKRKYNIYDLTGEYGVGWTSNTNEPFYFDLEEYNRIKIYCWYKHINGYIITTIYANEKRNEMRLHRYLMNAENGDILDHINRKKYDNRKINLRLVTASQNCINITRRKDNASGITGVNWNNRDEVWESYIGINNDQIYLGRFDYFEDAVDVRRLAEEKYHGEYSPNN